MLPCMVGIRSNVEEFSLHVYQGVEYTLHLSVNLLQGFHKKAGFGTYVKGQTKRLFAYW